MARLDEMFDVRGKSVIVAGGAAGLGRAMAEIMAQQGARVCLFDIDGDGLDRTVAEIGAATGAEVWGQRIDVGDRAALARGFDAVAARHGGIDTVFANAGIDPGPWFMTATCERQQAGAIEDIPDAQWDRGIEINLTSVYSTVKNAVRHMKPQGRGEIIVTSSIASMINESIVGTSYMPTKAAVNHFVRHMAMELGAYGIRINAILPGPFMTNIAGGRLRHGEVRAAFERQCLIGRMGDVEDIKGLALLLASPAGSFFTGSLVVIDGGALTRMT